MTTKNKEEWNNYCKERLDNNPELREKARQSSRDWYAKNKETEKEKNRNYCKENPKKTLYWTAKGNAKRKGIDFNLTESDLIIPDTCIIMGIELSLDVGGRTNNRASIDRIDSTKGYTKDNIQIISSIANRMKSDSTKEELLIFAKGVLKLYGEV